MRLRIPAPALAMAPRVLAVTRSAATLRVAPMARPYARVLLGEFVSVRTVSRLEIPNAKASHVFCLRDWLQMLWADAAAVRAKMV